MRERKDYTPEIHEEKRNWVAPLVIGAVSIVAVGLIGVGFYAISLNHSDTAEETSATETTKREMVEPPEEFEEHEVCASYTNEELQEAYNLGYDNGQSQCDSDWIHENIGKATSIFAYNGNDAWEVKYYEGCVAGYKWYYNNVVIPCEEEPTFSYTNADLQQAYNEGYSCGYDDLWRDANCDNIGKATTIYAYNGSDAWEAKYYEGCVKGYKAAYAEYLAQEKQETAKQETTTTAQKKSNTTTSTQSNNTSTTTQSNTGVTEEGWKSGEGRDSNTSVADTSVTQADTNAWNNPDAHGSFIMDGQTYTY